MLCRTAVSRAIIASQRAGWDGISSRMADVMVKLGTSSVWGSGLLLTGETVSLWNHF